MTEWKREEQGEFRDKINAIREEARRHIQSLEAVFNDRIQILKEEMNESNKSNEQIIKTCR